nr:hypothetical protein KitaXyl93_77270 [Kitasatospora sp. Xyl93]
MAGSRESAVGAAAKTGRAAVEGTAGAWTAVPDGAVGAAAGTAGGTAAAAGKSAVAQARTATGRLWRNRTCGVPAAAWATRSPRTGRASAIPKAGDSAVARPAVVAR